MGEILRSDREVLVRELADIKRRLRDLETKPPTPFRWTQVISSPGPLNLSGTYDKLYDSSLMLFFTASSGYILGTVGLYSVAIVHDGVQVANNQFFYNVTGEHHSLTPRMFSLAGVSAGSHTVAMNAQAGLSSDANDAFYVYALEVPSAQNDV